MTNQKFEVQQYTHCEGWVNTWTEGTIDGEQHPETFETEQAAREELDQFFREVDDEIRLGVRKPEDGFDREEFRVVPCFPSNVRLEYMDMLEQVRDQTYLDPIQALAEPLDDDKVHLVLSGSKISHLFENWPKKVNNFLEFREVMLKIIPVSTHLISQHLYRPLSASERFYLVHFLWALYVEAELV